MAGNPAAQGSPENLKAKLRDIFHLKEFRDNQLEAITATFEGKDVFVVGDNGAGKSLCYQLPACLSRGVTVVISPTISLIQDQMQNLTELVIVARKILAAREDRDAGSIYKQLTEEVPKKIELLYVTPEKVTMSDPLIDALQSLLRRGLLARFVIDEAQCISQYDSENFRPSFRKLNKKIKRDFPGVPMIALSGPVRKSTQEDILKSLPMNDPQVFTMTLNRTNLKYAVLTDMDCITWITEQYPHDSGIVYCETRVNCVSMAERLNKAGLQACSYHAGKRNSYRDREIVQNKWNGKKFQVICATAQSFGFGIDNPDVRYVIHTFLPKSMENYYRESGRAGRRKEKEENFSHCILFCSKSDKGVNNNESSNRLVNQGTMVEYCQNMEKCRRQLLTYLGRKANACLPNSKAICDNCERRQAGAAATR